MATIAEAFAIAVAHHQAGRLAAAEQIYRQILQAEPNHPDALHYMGVLLHQCGGNAEAVRCLAQAIAIRPGVAHFHLNLGVVYAEMDQLEAAEASFRRAVQLQPDLADAHGNLGNALRLQGKLDAAADCCQRAVKLDPSFADAHNNLATVLLEKGDVEGAAGGFREAIRLRPTHHAAHSNLVYTLSLSPGCDARAVWEECCRWDRQHAAPLCRLIPSHPNDRTPDRRLRIGYVSPDFSGHPVGRFLLPLLESHDHARFEIFCYASVRAPDAVTDACRAAADTWRDVVGQSDEQVAAIVCRDRVDILVDLTMHMAGNRLLLFARKPAPVQVSYLAYCGATGLTTIDYRLTDPYLDPPGGEQRSGGEQPIRLPETYWCYRSTVLAPPVGPLPALRSGQVTFGCLNNFAKVTGPTLLAWSRLLQTLPESRLLLHARPGSHRDRVRDLVARQGVRPERLGFVDRLAAAEYFRVYGQIDVALDPFPFGGGTTTCDALWMGVPVVSLAGPTAVGRSGLSILSNLGRAEWVARDGEQYLRIAVELARDLPRLEELRGTLRAQMRASPLMDAPRFARNVEAAYRMMWQRWCGR